MSVTSQRSTLPKPGWMPSLASHSSRMLLCFYWAMNSVTTNGSSHIWLPIMVVLNLCLLCTTALMWTTVSFINGHWVLQRKIFVIMCIFCHCSELCRIFFVVLTGLTFACIPNAKYMHTVYGNLFCNFLCFVTKIGTFIFCNFEFTPIKIKVNRIFAIEFYSNEMKPQI